MEIVEINDTQVVEPMKRTNSNYISVLKSIITAKHRLKDLYDQIIGLVDSGNLSKSISETIKDLKDDDEDHLSVLNSLLMDEVEDEFSEIIEEDDDE